MPLHTPAQSQVDVLALMEAARLCGTWDRLRAFREQERRRLRAAGRRRTEANDESWRTAEAAYRPTLGPLFRSFTEPPSTFRDAQTLALWCRVNETAAELCERVGYYSAAAADVVRATAFRRRIDKRARPTPTGFVREHAAEFWDADAAGPLREALYIFGVRIGELSPGNRLHIAVQRELDAWRYLLPELMEIVQESGGTSQGAEMPTTENLSSVHSGAGAFKRTP